MQTFTGLVTMAPLGGSVIVTALPANALVVIKKRTDDKNNFG
jgi:hypothetical protein